MRRSGATARRGSPSMAAGKGGGYRGRVGWGVARPIVRRGLVGVSGKRRARGWGFETGQALTNGRASLVPAIGRQTGNSLRRPYLAVHEWRLVDLRSTGHRDAPDPAWRCLPITHHADFGLQVEHSRKRRWASRPSWSSGRSRYGTTRAGHSARGAFLR